MEYAGKLVIIEVPVMPKEENGLLLLGDAQKQKEDEFAKSWNRLKVKAVGVECTWVKPGDEVLITPKQLSYADTFVIDDVAHFVVQESHCIGKW
jgi:hypothetical protein